MANAHAELTVLARRPAAPAWQGGPLRARLLRLRPPRLTLGLAAVALLAHALLWGLQAPWGRAPLPGALLLGAALLWMGWAWRLHRAAGNPIRPTDEPVVLVDEGPFRVGRHPMYLALLAGLLGAALVLGAPLLAAAALALALLLDRVHVRHEEAVLAQRFGGWWRDYAAGVRRWL